MLFSIGLMALLVGASCYTHSVFIENTDAMGIVLNSQMPRMMERALIGAGIGDRLASANIMKYRASSILGDELTWDVLSSKKDDGTVKVTCINDAEKLLFSASKVSTTLAPRKIFNKEETKKYQFCSHFRVWDDELLYDDKGSTLSTLTNFNLFERARTNILGGPTALRALMEGDKEAKGIPNVNVVVVRVKNYRLYDHDMKEPKLIEEEPLTEVLTNIEHLGGGMLDFHQVAVCSGSSPSQLISSATITCLCVDAVTNSPAEIGLLIPK